MEAAQPSQPSDEALASLRVRLVRRATSLGIPPDDAEDVVQEALIKVVREHPRPNAPVLEVRGHVALRETRADFYRRLPRTDRGQRAVSLDEPDARLDKLTVEPEHERLIEVCQLARQIVGPDSFDYAIVKAFYRATDAEVARMLGWTHARTAAARVQLGRKRTAVLRAIRDSLEGG